MSPSPWSPQQTLHSNLASSDKKMQRIFIRKKSLTAETKLQWRMPAQQ